MTKQNLQEELKKAMIARDELRTSVLRLLLSSVNYYEIQKGGAGYEATPEDILSVIQKEAKQRRDSIAEYEKAGRQDLVDKERDELNILQSFLPVQMEEDKVREEVDKAISETG